MNKFLVTRCADGRVARTGAGERSQWVRAFRDFKLNRIRLGMYVCSRDWRALGWVDGLSANTSEASHSQ